MVVAFEERTGSPKYLILVLIVLIVASSFLLVKHFLLGKESQGITVPAKKIEIDFEVLKNPILKELQPFEKIEPVEKGKVGRENPLTPY